MLADAVVGLLHVLVFVYWLGGDLGAFYTSRYLTRPGVHAGQRLLAAKIVGDVDMAPRTALILTLPTGLWLAATRGWLAMPGWVLVVVTVGGLAWLGLAWWLHLRHVPPGAVLRRVDLAVRWAVLGGLLGVAAAGLMGQLAVPLFLALKFGLLASAIAVGLWIRATLSPLGAALGGLTGPNTAQAEANLGQVLRRARPQVTLIWIIITTAALLGLWTPA